MVACCAANAEQPHDALPKFHQDVRPLLRSHCVKCHGQQDPQAGVRLDNLSPQMADNAAVAEQWHDVLRVLNTGEMPPAEARPLTPDQLATLTRWLHSAVERAVAEQRKTGGRVVQRRLNRDEYQHTMTDLLGIEMDYARDLPPDPVSGDGFLNCGESLQMSAMQLEAYLETARRALNRVIVRGPTPKIFHEHFSQSNVKGWLRTVERSNRLGRSQEFLATMIDDYCEEGEFLVRVNLTADLKPKAGFPLLELSLGYRPDTKILFREVDMVEITSAEPQTLEFRGRIENHPLPVRGQGKYPGLVIRLRNAYDDGSPKPKSEFDKQNNAPVFPDEPHLPTVTIESLEFHAPVFDRWPPPAHRAILFDSPLRQTDERAYVREVLARFLPRAYRRPVSEPEVGSLVDFFESIRDEFPTFEEAIRETLVMVLIRPEFLYLVEPAGDEKRALSDWELASRLSYLLWSTMPDERLSELAAKGRLHRPHVLAKQVDRMLADERSTRFVNAFVDQWLHLDVLDQIAVNRQVHPRFDDQLKQSMRQETRSFFRELLQHDLSALHLLDSEFTMLNEPLAKHYGIEQVFGHAFRRVALNPSQHRGGLLGHASVLMSNSTGADSHPIRRAVWIRDRLLNDPPAPPPPDVPTLDQAREDFLQLSIREQLEIHRGTQACAACHRGIDPWGIALENFDAVGLWRDEIVRQVGKTRVTFPVDAADVLPSRGADQAYQVSGVDDLRAYLVTQRQEDFAKSLVARLATYALGRPLELSDRGMIEQLSDKFASDGYQLRGLVQTIVASKSFQTK